MKRILAAIVLFALALAPQRLTADPSDIAAAARSVVRVVLVNGGSGDYRLVGHGSGFAVGPDLVLTNAHVVAPLASDRSMRVGIVPPQGASGYFARIVAYAPRQDLALLRLSEKGSLTPATLFSGSVTDGQDVWAVGYPGNVDAAQGYTETDLMSPSAPVKTHGNISAGRNGRGFDSLLHTAQLAAGNSGGPLLDGCGRVLGANSFGTESESEADSSFYFAVSIREISRFLLANGVTAQLTGEPCQSLAEFQSAQDQRLASERAAAEELARAAATKRDAALARATRQAQFDIISSRENRMAVAALALLLGLAAGAGAMWFGQNRKRRERKIATIAAFTLIAGAVIAWFTRPSIAEIDSLAAEIAASGTPEPSASAAPLPATEGALICMIDASRSRVTISPTTDVPLDWRGDGCVNGKSQYVPGPEGWIRVLAPKGEDNVTVAIYDPQKRVYRTDRYLLDAETVAQIRQARGTYEPPQCNGGEEAIRRLSDAQAAVRALLPVQPNERLVYTCTKVP